MPNTYTQIHLQLIFAVKNRISLIQDVWKKRLNQYITGIVQNHQHKVIAINGMPDHLHLVIGMRPTQSIADLLLEIKRDSSKWINKNELVRGKFEWQDGYGAFSYAKSSLPFLIDYVKNQEIHHRKKSFLAEYTELLQEFEVEYNERYLFQEIE
jgi:Transposase and inactivated derivatives